MAIQTTKVDSVTSVTIENRATGQVKVSVDYAFLGMSPSVTVTPEKAEEIAAMLTKAAATARAAA